MSNSKKNHKHFRLSKMSTALVIYNSPGSRNELQVEVLQSKGINELHISKSNNNSKSYFNWFS